MKTEHARQIRHGIMVGREVSNLIAAGEGLVVSACISKLDDAPELSHVAYRWTLMNDPRLGWMNDES
jgi:hypothetical protein